MNLSVICFTPNGYDRMKELNSIAFEDISIEMFCKCSRLKEECADFYVEEDLSSWTKKQFEKKLITVFDIEYPINQALKRIVFYYNSIDNNRSWHL